MKTNIFNPWSMGHAFDSCSKLASDGNLLSKSVKLLPFSSTQNNFYLFQRATTNLFGRLGKREFEVDKRNVVWVNSNQYNVFRSSVQRKAYSSLRPAFDS